MASGAKKWDFKTGGMVASTPAVAGGLVYFTSADGNLYALDAASGAKKWTFPYVEGFGDMYDIYLSSPTVLDSLVYFGGGEVKVYALDAATGKQVWVYETAKYDPNVNRLFGFHSRFANGSLGYPLYRRSWTVSFTTAGVPAKLPQRMQNRQEDLAIHLCFPLVLRILRHYRRDPLRRNWIYRKPHAVCFGCQNRPDRLVTTEAGLAGLHPARGG